MTDIFTKEKRSEIMSKIRGKWTKPERLAHNTLKGNRVRHRMHPKMPCNPDILLGDGKTVIFIDGCFWHGHHHCSIPKTAFWRNKINNNIRRDRKSTRLLRRLGYRVVRIWECRLSPARLLAAAEAA